MKLELAPLKPRCIIPLLYPPTLEFKWNDAVYNTGSLSVVSNSNTIITIGNNAGQFKLIDWRNEFAGSTEIGDIYYDLAKMAGGLIINYANIKNHNFDIEFDENNVLLSVPNIDNITIYQEKLYDFAHNKNLDIKKIKQLIPIIFWNMSPLHTAPFDQFLWYLGLKLFSQNEEIL